MRVGNQVLDVLIIARMLFQLEARPRSEPHRIALPLRHHVGSLQLLDTHLRRELALSRIELRQLGGIVEDLEIRLLMLAGNRLGSGERLARRLEVEVRGGKAAGQNALRIGP